MGKEKIIITVSGRAMSGKARLSFLLKKFLRENGFDVKHEVTLDYRNENHFEREMCKNFDEYIEDIKETREILIKEEQLHRNYFTNKNESYNCGACGIKCKRVVGVIASDNNDFLNWKDVDAGFDNIPLKRRRIFIANDVLYYGIIKIDHIHSITFDEVIETKNAKENSEYDRIIYAIRPTLGRR